MLTNNLIAIRSRVIENFCRAMEFKAFTDLAYKYSSEISKAMPPSKSIIIGYSKFAHSLGLRDKLVAAPEIAGQLEKAREDYFLDMVHQHQISLFETLIFDIFRALLKDRPERLPARKQIDYTTILKAPDRESIIDALIERELNEIKYKNVRDWFACVQNFCSACKFDEEEISRIAEAKATRDLLVHNSGIINHVYLTKADKYARGALGEKISVAGTYTLDIWKLLSKVLLALIDQLQGSTSNA